MNRVDPCGSCHRSLVWLKHQRTGNVAPIDFVPADNGNVIPIDDEGDATPIVSAVAYRVLRKGEASPAGMPTHLNHFASCRDAERYRPRHHKGDSHDRA